MSKETYYLKHDYNSRNDEKILKLRRKHEDGSGYAIYWMLLEKLGESSEGRLKLDDIENIAFDLHFSCERIADVINQYMLFENDGIYFWSNRLLSDLAERDEKSKQGKLAAKVRWDKERKKMQTHCERNAGAMQGKERKGKESIAQPHEFETFWKPLPKKITLSKKITTVIEKDNASLSKKLHTIDNTTKDNITISSPTSSDRSLEVLKLFNSLTSQGLRMVPQKKKQIEARLRNFTMEEIEQAIRNRLDDPNCMGANSQNKIWAYDWNSLFRNDQNFERALNLKGSILKDDKFYIAELNRLRMHKFCAKYGDKMFAKYSDFYNPI